MEIVLVSDQEITQLKRQHETEKDFDQLGVDLIVTLDNGFKYLGCLVTIEVLNDYFSNKDDVTTSIRTFYWCKQLIVVKDIEMKTIKKMIDEMLDQSIFSKAFEKIN